MYWGFLDWSVRSVGIHFGSTGWDRGILEIPVVCPSGWFCVPPHGADRWVPYKERCQPLCWEILRNGGDIGGDGGRKVVRGVRLCGGQMASPVWSTLRGSGTSWYDDMVDGE